jgi:cyclophilin family peptidyl-prolyl cis-trans isomerase
MNKQLIGLILLISCILLAVNCGGPKQAPQQTMKTEALEEPATQIEKETTAMQTQKTEPVPETPKDGKYVVISVKSGDEKFGNIKIELYKKEAPKTTENFIKLVNQGFYTGLTFHRVIPGFVVQGGDPKGDGTGGPGYTVPAEISPNLKHVRGAVATARQGDQFNPTKASSGSQFYICHAPTPNLNGNYTIFGIVVQGLDVVDKIAAVKTGPGDRPTTPVVMEKLWIE